ncbi:MAG: DUF6602 domain-containing protein [Thermodesulfobacteriota bacterium]
MLLSHINAIEKVLLAQSEAAKNAGHPNLRGGPREWFIRDFLENHIPTSLEIGQGEIIDEDSEPNPPPERYRPQVDIVIYRRDLPKITYSKGNAAFLSEGVMATIEVKSYLDQKQLKEACKASIKNRSLIRTPPLHGFGKIPTDIAYYVIAYDGPGNIGNIAKWFRKISNEVKEPQDRLVDIVVILGKGVIGNSNILAGLLDLKVTEKNHWAYFEQIDTNLFIMFMHMLTWFSFLSSPPDTSGYIKPYLDFTSINLI